MFRKAQSLVLALYNRFAKTDPTRFNFPDINSLSVLADNVLPMVLIQKGIINVSDKLKQLIQTDTDLGSKELESQKYDIKLRAAAVVAAERLRRKMESFKGVLVETKQMLQGENLGLYLRLLGSEEELRDCKRPVNRSTVFY
jgi:hypothetical protein